MNTSYEYAFAPMASLDVREQAAENTRQFLGDGTAFLKVPRLLELLAVRVGNTVLPTVLSCEVPTDQTLMRLKTMEMPSAMLGKAFDGTPVLRRNLCSNDGIWQDGEAVYVQGTWADESKAADDKKAGK